MQPSDGERISTTIAGRPFDGARGNQARVGDDEEIGLGDVVRPRIVSSGASKISPEVALLEVCLELTLKALRDALMDRAGRGRSLEYARSFRSAGRREATIEFLPWKRNASRR